MVMSRRIRLHDPAILVFLILVSLAEASPIVTVTERNAEM